MDLSLMNRKQLRGEVFETNLLKLGVLQARFYYHHRFYLVMQVITFAANEAILAANETML